MTTLSGENATSPGISFSKLWAKVSSGLKSEVTLPTIGGRKRFSAKMDRGIITVVLESTNKRRTISKNDFKRVFDKFEELKTFNTSTYQKITVNSVYILALIKHFSS